MTAPTPMIEWRGVRKGFDAGPVLDDFNLAVLPGQSMVIIGPSGQGKSVALKLAVGLLRPDRGSVRLMDEDSATLRPKARRGLFAKVGVLFQNAALFDSLTVWENVAFRLINADKTPRRAARDQAYRALASVRLPEQVAERYPGELSGGMQKRVGLARAVVADPAILFFDEPTTGLDPITAAAINDLIIDQVRRLGCTAVSITHDLASARVIADDVALLHRGRIAWRGPVARLDDSGDPRVDQFVKGRARGPMT
jgi:phospholipid/cholesterol/gamma-HCH transport system ATP-binding protein